MRTNRSWRDDSFISRCTTARDLNLIEYALTQLKVQAQGIPQPSPTHPPMCRSSSVWARGWHFDRFQRTGRRCPARADYFGRVLLNLRPGLPKRGQRHLQMAATAPEEKPTATNMPAGCPSTESFRPPPLPVPPSTPTPLPALSRSHPLCRTLRCVRRWPSKPCCWRGPTSRSSPPPVPGHSSGSRRCPLPPTGWWGLRRLTEPHPFLSKTRYRWPVSAPTVTAVPFQRSCSFGSVVKGGVGPNVGYVSFVSCCIAIYFPFNYSLI